MTCVGSLLDDMEVWGSHGVTLDWPQRGPAACPLQQEKNGRIISIVSL